MVFKMDTQDLLEGLNIVTRALAARPAKQILDGVLMEASDNRITLTCSDGAFSIEYTNEAQILEEGQAVLPGKLLNELIRKLPAGNVSVTVKNGRMAQIQCLKNRSNLSVMNAAEYPETISLRSGTEIRIPQKRLKDMISHVLFSMATDESRQILTGCLLEVSHTEARMVALDGFRLAMQKLYQPFELQDGQEVLKAIIPGKVMTELSRILPEDDAFCSIRVDNGRMQCSFGNIRLTAVLLSGEFIDYRRIISMDFTSEARANRTEVLDAIDRASLMAREGKNNLIKMSFRKDVLKITSNAEMGDVEEEVDVTMVGNDLDIAFNARYIIDIIRNVPEEELNMKFRSNVSPCLFLPLSGDEYLYLILPVRVFQ